MQEIMEETSLVLCTLFDSRFAIQGLAMIDSVERYATSPIEWNVLALDDIVLDQLLSLERSNLKVLALQDLQDSDLLKLIGVRPWNEVCWTSASCLLHYANRQANEDQVVAYIDADCFFFDDINRFFISKDIGSKIFIHEHNFSQDRKEWLLKSGRFNVGLVGGVKSDEFSSCIAEWRDQVLEDCSVDPELGKCGDQTYLNDWPIKYPSTKIVDDVGVGIAPWNTNNYDISTVEGFPSANENRILFYHFHGLKFAYLSKYMCVFFIAPGYRLKWRELTGIYRIYIVSLMKQTNSVLFMSFVDRKMGLNWFLRNFARTKISLYVKRPKRLHKLRSLFK